MTKEFSLPDYKNTRGLLLQLRLVTNKNSRKVLDLLKKNKELSVSDIHTSLGMEQSVASQILANLRKFSMVSCRRDGKNIYYSLDKEHIVKLTDIVVDFCSTIN